MPVQTPYQAAALQIPHGDGLIVADRHGMRTVRQKSNRIDSGVMTDETLTQALAFEIPKDDIVVEAGGENLPSIARDHQTIDRAAVADQIGPRRNNGG